MVALPLMKYVLRNGQRLLPLNIIAYLLGRLGWVEEDRLKIDLASGLSAATLAFSEEWAVADGRLDWSATSETGFLQRVLTLAAELSAAGELPAALKVTADSFVPFVGHDDSADWSGSWQSRMKVSSLMQSRMLGPYADVALLFGPMLHEDVRTDPGGHPTLVAATLARWATSGSLSGFASAHQQLPLLVAVALKEHVLPIELCACIADFPAMLRDLDARLARSDASKRPNVLIGRFPCALRSLSALDELLAGEAKIAKYDVACCVLDTQLPKVSAPSLVAFHQLDWHLAAEGFDLGGDTAADRINAIDARDARDDYLHAASPYCGSGSGSGSSGKTTLESNPKARLHNKASAKVLQMWLNSPDVAGPIVYTVAPVAVAFGVAPMAGVPDETRSGVGELIAHHLGLGESSGILRFALARRSVPLAQAVVFGVCTSHLLFGAISSARDSLAACVSNKLATLDDGTLEMECTSFGVPNPTSSGRSVDTPPGGGRVGRSPWKPNTVFEKVRSPCRQPAAVGTVEPQTAAWRGARAAIGHNITTPSPH